MFLQYVSALPINERSYFCGEVPIATASPYEYPNAEMAVKRDHYVDDFICSTDPVPEAAKLISDVTIVHARGLRYPGWATNAPELKKACRRSRPRRPPPCHLHKTKTERALGLIWEPECDSLGFDVTFKKLPRDIVNGKISLRKGNFEPDSCQSSTRSVFCPVTIKEKRVKSFT
ncbi:hypothetical protein EVAR_38382_1 [Eumeta japonica]|uniref:Uncharacterized protein n=1 Tax=Eumeta variegata TaxID=151549 RepID=A0A4C1YL06_EUMVA|nr:hypothetical protein EVAR_38382_1 [Eumeta japonica]